VAADRAARQAAASISPKQLNAAAARPLLTNDYAIVGGDEAETAATGASHTAAAAAPAGGQQDRDKSARCRELLGWQGYSAGDLLFCGKYWLLQVDQKTGEGYYHFFNMNTEHCIER
jgi:hypothetical protein